MSRRSRGREDARRKAQNPGAGRPPGKGPTIRPTVPPRLTSEGRAEQWDECPVCGAEIFEEGGMGCCGALVAECQGAVDGVAVDWDSLTDEQDEALRDRAVSHAWYLDTGEPAPSEYTPSAERIACRCEGRPHVHI